MTTMAGPTTKTIPLVESFGPTIQGEGFLAGLPTVFLRCGLCDYRCVWCDSKYAVEPDTVKREARRLSCADLLREVWAFSDTPGMWITLSGGNPAMHELGSFVSEARAAGFLTSVETQGSLWKDWLGTVDHLTVSPKPPSSGQLTDRRVVATQKFIERAEAALPPAARSVKIVVFDEDDYEWAAHQIDELNWRRSGWHTFLSVGTPSTTTWGSEVVKAVNDRQVRDEIGDQYRWLCERAAADARLVKTRLFPQLHVVAWGHSRGV